MNTPNIHSILVENYLLIKACHLIAVISWMAAMLYLPRIFVYHTQVAWGSETDRIFQTMEYRLQKYIMTPSMILTLIFGLMLIYIIGFQNFGKWLHIKLLFVTILFIIHAMLSFHRKQFAKGLNKKSTLYFRILNEVPTICMVTIVILAVLKPL
jgi:putative membrane protein